MNAAMKIDLDEDTCYQAIAARDRRFEGRFVVAVRTTGVYCRPGCPAPLPRRKNVRFFACAAAAEQEGFRPCMRCRPDGSPTCTAAIGTSVTVARALRLIEQGALDGEGDVEALAERLGVGARHLRRLFEEHLGTSPARLALTRRVHVARKLIDETRLPMTAIALGTGFQSVRRFNDAIRQTFQKPPRALRRGGGAAKSQTDAVSLRVPFVAPYDWDEVLGFLGARAAPGLEAVDGGAYRRAIAEGAWIEVSRAPREPALSVVVHGERAVASPPMLLDVARRVARLFDANAQPAAIGAHLAKDAVLRPLVRARPGLRVPGAWDPFELAVRAVLGQQITVRAATRLAGAIAGAFGPRAVEDDQVDFGHLFPAPAALAEADVGKLGMPRARAETIRALARAVADGRVVLDPAAAPADEIAASLVALPGIGQWTASYVAMRALGDPDALPLGDLGLRRAFAALAPGEDLARASERWRPWRAYACLHLWSHPGDER